ncbi:glycoside hydrolase family 5 protein [Zasmidium cellare ATCC 36951]|uniref:glucan 1,3-beta-glucosidase n=1 Tax=Zasmidium cellare ATCC 36951 TaxID=1080233 RepID=A0A6A6CPE7_ZASCE|nr:glycoside hydrolase family 5 protein [Zasmidium cellare ATCC 36951]KAF2168000.1 glycoside hydrolase family 5 protein [Zasmidium cellare ATCC 36951]
MVNLGALAGVAFAAIFAVVDGRPQHHHIHHRSGLVSAKVDAGDSYASTNGTNSTSIGNTTLPDVIRGVNIGGWLILEKWMTPDIFDNTDAVDQYSFDSTDGAEAKLKQHWETYFTEADVQKIASWGINAMRIPIGYWDFFNDTTPYIRGADAYLDKAIGWARKAGLKVLVDCHGSPGSQNGFDNSGRSGNVKWQTSDNLSNSIKALQNIATKYGSTTYADVVFAIQLVNEPISWAQNNFTLTQTWTQQAYHAVKSASTNPHLQILMHDGFMTPWAWQTIGAQLNGPDTNLSTAPFAIDTHLYQNQVAADSTLTQAQHIAKACNWTASNLLPSTANLPVYVGEFSAQTNICVYLNGTTVGGDACYEDGCQCSCNVDIQDWGQPLVKATRMFLEAELEAFEEGARGWFLWSYKGPGAWGLRNLVEFGVLGKGVGVGERMFLNQCGFE